MCSETSNWISANTKECPKVCHTFCEIINMNHSLGKPIITLNPLIAVWSHH